MLSQLYIRQVLAHLIDQNTMIKHFMDGYGTPTYGPAPIYPLGNPFVSYGRKDQPLPVLGLGGRGVAEGSRLAGEPGRGGRLHDSRAGRLRRGRDHRARSSRSTCCTRAASLIEPGGHRPLPIRRGTGRRADQPEVRQLQHRHHRRASPASCPSSRALRPAPGSSASSECSASRPTRAVRASSTPVAPSTPGRTPTRRSTSTSTRARSAATLQPFYQYENLIVQQAAVDLAAGRRPHLRHRRRTSPATG